MKKILLLICSLSLAFGLSAQNVFIADNNFNAPTGANIFPTIQEAIDAASAGDFIYIQPSVNTYGNAVFDKELHIRGIGFDLDKDLPFLSVMGFLTLENNADNTSNPSNSTIKGMQISVLTLRFQSGSVTYNLDGVTVENCFVSTITGTSAAIISTANLQVIDSRFSSFTLTGSNTNLLIRNNLITTAITFNSSLPQSVIITNNILYASISKVSEGDSFIIKNNNFIGSKNSNIAFSSMRDAVIANNIFYGRTPSNFTTGESNSTSFQRNIFTNNLTHETGNDDLPPVGGGVSITGDGNIEATSPLFVDVPILNSWADTHDFTLQAGSPVLGAGSDGEDIGITGGPFGFTESNFQLDTTPLPTIQILNTSTVINPGDDLDVRIRAKSN